MNHQEKILIFDFDRTIGTLITDWDKWRKGVLKIINEFDPNPDISVENVKHGDQNHYIEKYGKEFRLRLNEFNQEYEAEEVVDFVLNEELIDFIKGTDVNLCIWSSNSHKTVEKYLDELNILEKFEIIISRDEVFYLKPDTEGFSLIKKEDIPLDTYILIGDSLSDKHAAENVGITFVGTKLFGETLQND